MKRRKVKINKKAKREIDRYPLVEVHWYDIVSDSNWQSIAACKKAKLPPCITKRKSKCLPDQRIIQEL